MKLTVPKYYKNFKCIDKNCEDTCCAGWEVDLDEEAYAYYENVEGDFGKRLKSVMSRAGGPHFVLKENKDCPFLNENKLCDLYIALGEDKLCTTCAMFPRFVEEYGNVREMGIAFSCKSAAELILSYEGEFETETSEDNKPLTSYNDINAEFYFGLRNARKVAYDIAQNKNFTVKERAALLLLFSDAIQHSINGHRFSRIQVHCEMFSDEEKLSSKLRGLKRKYSKFSDKYQQIKKMLEVFSDMETVKDTFSIFVKEDLKCYLRQEFPDEKGFLNYYGDKCVEFEHILVYYIFRYFLKAVYDEKLLAKVKMGIVGFITVLEMDLMHWKQNDNTLTFDDQVEITHLYSREVEHSDINFARLEQMFENDEVFATDSLMKMLLN